MQHRFARFVSKQSGSTITKPPCLTVKILAAIATAIHCDQLETWLPLLISLCAAQQDYRYLDHFISFKGEVHPKPKLSMFCVLSQFNSFAINTKNKTRQNTKQTKTKTKQNKTKTKQKQKQKQKEKKNTKGYNLELYSCQDQLKTHIFFFFVDSFAD